MLAMGGLMGLPGAEDLLNLTKFMAKEMFGEHFNPELEARKLIVDLAGGEIPPDLILLGASRYGFGMPALMDFIGLPKAQVDLSGSMSFGQIIPGFSELLNAQGMGFSENINRAMTDVAGAGFGPGINIVKMLGDSQLPIDDFKRLERGLPRGMANLLKAYRLVAEGRERTRTGATVVEYNIGDPNHLAEIIAQGLGFSSTRLSQRWDREAMLRETDNYWMTRRRILMAGLNHGYSMGDQEMVEDYRQDVRKYNKEVPYPGLRIRGADLARSRKGRVLANRNFVLGLGRTRRARGLAEEIREYYPEVEDASRMR